MAIAKIQGSQRDFSAGELDVSMKRADDNPMMKAGTRQASNWRILNSKGLRNRQGRSALFLSSGRVEEVTVFPGVIFRLCFISNALVIRDTAGAVVFSQTGLPWVQATVGQVVWCLVPRDVQTRDVVICFPGMPPQIARYIKNGAWTIQNFGFGNAGDGSSNAAFFRLAPPGITAVFGPASPVTPGNIVNVSLSANYFVPGMFTAGKIFRWMGYQMRALTYVNAQQGLFTIIQTLPQAYFYSCDNFIGMFSPGDVVSNGGNLFGQVTAVVFPAPGLVQMNVNQFTNANFQIGQQMTGPNGTAVITGFGNIVPQGNLIWDETIVDGYSGWPASCSFDQDRLIFSNIPSLPGAIIWSRLGSSDDFVIGAGLPGTSSAGAQPTDPIFEFVPGNRQVYFVVPGPESSEFVFCDTGIYYVPISPTNPLRPGSVQFQLVSSDGSANVQPRVVQEVIIYVNAGQTSINSIIAPGAYYRPYETRSLTDFHQHLFNSPIAIAIPSADDVYPERYMYVLNSDGTVAVGIYTVEKGDIKGVVGWVPWFGSTAAGAVVNWISALSDTVLFTSTYTVLSVDTVNRIPPVSVVEKIDVTRYLDGSVFVNNLPAALTPPVGKGPLWFLPGPAGTVNLMDQGTRMMGTYGIDANGFIIPQFNGGEDLTAPTLVAGQSWTATLEPFVPDAQPGQDVHQRMQKRRLSRIAAYVINSTGFYFARLFSGPLTNTSPSLGTAMNLYRVPAWNQGDNPTAPPPLREEVKRWRPVGRSFDPRVAIVKDTPGPLEIAEVGIESTI